MLVAGDRMTNTSDSISEIAQSLGYESANAFTKVLKKIMGCSPRQYSRGQNSVLFANIGIGWLPLCPEGCQETRGLRLAGVQPREEGNHSQVDVPLLINIQRKRFPSKKLENETGCD